MAYATVEDVQARLNRPLTDEEEGMAETLLGDVEAILRSRIPDLDERAENPDYLALVVQVEANAVLRVIRNPDGFRQETDGNYSYTVSAAVASGHLFVMDSEWALLGVTKGAFTITPHLRAPGCAP
ncbi:Gp19/Gp15/Gp42 family protein [Nocardiopsis protaetiae]|uniref:Gp19/Gp15/Gp42 family protein n=1 Tax=Nocardiopsis protaetiae TaxID=3382270 RepID=UPI00387B1314